MLTHDIRRPKPKAQGTVSSFSVPSSCKNRSGMNTSGFEYFSSSCDIALPYRRHDSSECAYTAELMCRPVINNNSRACPDGLVRVAAPSTLLTPRNVIPLIHVVCGRGTRNAWNTSADLGFWYWSLTHQLGSPDATSTFLAISRGRTAAYYTPVFKVWQPLRANDTVYFFVCTTVNFRVAHHKVDKYKKYIIGLYASVIFPYKRKQENKPFQRR